MPWNINDYPASYKNFEPEVREKAIEIANALVRDGNEESRSISIAAAKAREYIHGNDKNRPEYVVKSRDDDWVLMKSNSKVAILKDNTKTLLLDKAKPYVNEHNGILSIYHEDGSIEDTLYD